MKYQEGAPHILPPLINSSNFDSSSFSTLQDQDLYTSSEVYVSDSAFCNIIRPSVRLPLISEGLYAIENIQNSIFSNISLSSEPRSGYSYFENQIDSCTITGSLLDSVENSFHTGGIVSGLSPSTRFSFRLENATVEHCIRTDFNTDSDSSEQTHTHRASHSHVESNREVYPPSSEQKPKRHKVDVLVSGTTFHLSSAQGGQLGGGAFITAERNATVKKCVFAECSSYSHGGAVATEDCLSVSFIACAFNWSSTDSGIGACVFDRDSIHYSIHDCTFVDCVARSGGGGGVYLLHTGKNEPVPRDAQ